MFQVMKPVNMELNGIEWIRYEDCSLPEIVRKVPHIAFEVDDINEAIKGKKK